MTNTNNDLLIAILGSSQIGKTALLLTLLHKTFPPPGSPIPNVLPVTTTTITVADAMEGPIMLHLHDTAADGGNYGDLDSQRREACDFASVVILCFAINRPDSLGDIESRWMGEVKKYGRSRDVLSVVLGLKTGAREAIKEDSGRGGIAVTSEDEGQAIAKRVGAVAYLECDARNGVDHVEQVFKEIAAVVLEERRKKRSRTIRRLVVGRDCVVL